MLPYARIWLVAVLLIAGVCSGIAQAAPVDPFVQLAADGQREAGEFEAVLSGTFTCSHEDPAQVLLDGDRRTTAKKGGAVKIAAGDAVTVKLAWKAPRCVTAVRAGFSGSLAAGFSWSSAAGTRHTPERDKTVTFARDYPATSYLVWERLAWNAAALEIEFRARKDSQLTEIEVVGFEDIREAPFLCIHREMNLPPVNHAISLDVVCYNPAHDALAGGALRVQEQDGEGDSRPVGRLEAPRVAPGTAVSLPVTWTTPAAAGEYRLSAGWHVGGAEGPVCRTECAVRVTRPKLHLVWYGEPAKVGHTTALTTVGDDLDAYDWRKQGVLPLSWAPGMVEREHTRGDFEENWASRIASKNRGIAIDEFGIFQTAEFGVGMANALLPVRRQFPDRPVYVWQAMAVGAPIAPALRRGADLVMHECYMEYLGHRYTSFDFMMRRIREYGLTQNSVFGLACTSENTSTSAEQLTEQFRYIRELAPELPGVAIYKAYGTGARLAPLTDQLFERYFLRPVVRTVLVRDLPDRVAVQNIGQMPARDVELELIGLPAGVSAETKTIALLTPGETAMVAWPLSRSELGRAQARVVEKPHYETVSLPKPAHAD